MASISMPNCYFWSSNSKINFHFLLFLWFLKPFFAFPRITRTYVMGTSLYCGCWGTLLPSKGIWVTVGMDLFTRTCLFSTFSPKRERKNLQMSLLSMLILRLVKYKTMWLDFGEIQTWREKCKSIHSWRLAFKRAHLQFCFLALGSGPHLTVLKNHSWWCPGDHIWWC